jgi:hypothetical protein
MSPLSVNVYNANQARVFAFWRMYGSRQQNYNFLVEVRNITTATTTKTIIKRSESLLVLPMKNAFRLYLL